MIEIHPKGYQGDLSGLVGRIIMTDAGFFWMAPSSPVRVEKVTKSSVHGTEVRTEWDADTKLYVPARREDPSGSRTSMSRASSIRAVCDTVEEVCVIRNMNQTNEGIFRDFKAKAIENIKSLTTKE